MSQDYNFNTAFFVAMMENIPKLNSFGGDATCLKEKQTAWRKVLISRYTAARMTSDLHRWPKRSSYASELWRLESCRELLLHVAINIELALIRLVLGSKLLF